MKHSFRIIIGMLLLAIPLCLNAQVKPTRPEEDNKTVSVKPVKADETQEKVEKAEKEKVEKPKGGPPTPRPGSGAGPFRERGRP